MNKSDLIKRMSAISGLPLEKSSMALDAYLQAVEEGMQAHDPVSVVGFGKFYVQNVKARTGRNLATGEVLEIPEKDIVKFRPGKQLVLSKKK